MKKRLVLMASLAMLLTLTTALALAQTGPGGAAPEDELLCLLPEGCDTNDDGTPDLKAGDPAPDPSAGNPVPGGEPGTGAVQYENAV